MYRINSITLRLLLPSTDESSVVIKTLICSIQMKRKNANTSVVTEIESQGSEVNDLGSKPLLASFHGTLVSKQTNKQTSKGGSCRAPMRVKKVAAKQKTNNNDDVTVPSSVKEKGKGEDDVPTVRTGPKRSLPPRKMKKFHFCPDCRAKFRFPSKLAEHVSNVHLKTQFAATRQSEGQNHHSGRKARPMKTKVTLKWEDSESAKFTKQLVKVIEVLKAAGNFVIVSGAGISVSAGIKAFRTVHQGNQWKNPDEKYFTAEFENANPRAFDRFFAEFRKSTVHCMPTPTHLFLSVLVESGRCLHWYNQNIDGLESKLRFDEGVLGSTIIFTHGRLCELICKVCGFTMVYQLSHVKRILEEGRPVFCTDCQGQASRSKRGGRRSPRLTKRRVIPNITLYGRNDFNLGERIEAAMKADFKAKVDVILVLGTTLKIPDMAKFVDDLQKANKHAVLVNVNTQVIKRKTPWDIELRGPCDWWVQKLKEIL